MIRSENIVFLSANSFTIPRISMKTAYFTHKMQEKIPQLMWQLELWRLGPECFKNRRSSQCISADTGNDPALGHTASSFMKVFERAIDTLMETQSCIVGSLTMKQGKAIWRKPIKRTDHSYTFPSGYNG